MYIPVWAIMLLSAIAGGLLTFMGIVIAVVYSNRKKGE